MPDFQQLFEVLHPPERLLTILLNYVNSVGRKTYAKLRWHRQKHSKFSSIPTHTYVYLHKTPWKLDCNPQHIGKKIDIFAKSLINWTTTYLRRKSLICSESCYLLSTWHKILVFWFFSVQCSSSHRTIVETEKLYLKRFKKP